MKTKIAVLGSNSFSGGSFVDYALAQDSQVLGISRSEETKAFFPPFDKARPAPHHHQFHSLDLNHDLTQIMAVLDEFKPDYVVNFAAQSMVAESWLHPEHWFMTNVVSTIRFHDQLRLKSYLKKYVHISTPEVYGSCTGQVLEHTPFNPSTPYAVSRAACDMSLQTFFRNYQFPVVFTRAANVFGPGQQLYRIIPRTILSIRLGQKLQLHGGGTSIRSFIHIRDVSRATFKIMQEAPTGEIYHLSTPRQISIRDCVQIICDQMGVQFKDVVENSQDRPGKDAAYLLDSSKVRSQLGWKEEITLEQGLQETITWVNDHFQKLSNEPLNYMHKP